MQSTCEIINGGILLLISVLIYFVPTIIAGIRGHRAYGSVAVVNLLFGWTFIGWGVALSMAFGGKYKIEDRW